MHWRGMVVPPLYTRMAAEFQDLITSGDYAAWVASVRRTGHTSRPARRVRPMGAKPDLNAAVRGGAAGQRGRPCRRVSTDLAIRRCRVSSVLAPVT